MARKLVGWIQYRFSTIDVVYMIEGRYFSDRRNERNATMAHEHSKSECLVDIVLSPGYKYI